MHHLALIGVAVLLGVVAAGLPVQPFWRMAQEDMPAGSSARISGSVWKWSADALAINGRAIGKVDAEFDSRALASGAVAYRIAVNGDGISGEGRLSANATGALIVADRAEIAIERIANFRILGERSEGVIVLENVELSFDRDGCTGGRGAVGAAVSTPLMANWSLSPLPLHGEIACVGGALELRLMGRDEAFGDIAVALRASPAEGRFQMALEMRPADLSIGHMLLATGFADQGDSFRYEFSGALI